MSVAPPPGVPLENGIVECRWNKCDFQFEDSVDLHEHSLNNPVGRVWKTYGEHRDKEEHIFKCLVQRCGRVKNGAP